jgi:hypothetical protein
MRLRTALRTDKSKGDCKMRKTLLVAIALLVIAIPAVAQPMVISTTEVRPVIAGIAQVVDINPDTVPVFDPITGQPVIDPLTGLQAVRRTWTNYMYFAPRLVTHLQAITLEKIVPERKVACGADWETAAHTITQQGIDDVQTKWPLLYEVDGTELRLTVTYTTDVRVGYPSPPFPVNVASRVHVETYSWIVDSDDVVPATPGVPSSLVLTSFNARLRFFSLLPAGTCETFAVTPAAVTKILTFIYGYGSPSLGDFIPGIADYLAMTPPNIVLAAQRFADLEAYIDSVCVEECDALYPEGLNAGTPDPNAQAILDNPTVPAASLLMNDLWAAGKELGVLIDK